MPLGIRPYRTGPDAIRYAFHAEAAPDKARPYSPDLGPDELPLFLGKGQTDGYRPSSLAACVANGSPRFAVVMEPNTGKWEWQTDVNLTTVELQTKATALAAKGFHPSCVTAYPFDGAVRYCAVSVKEPPKPVPYPKGPTLIEIPGWQFLTDATKEEMQKWLTDRKKDKHSVTWVDAYRIGDKPVFCAAARSTTASPAGPSCGITRL